MKWGSLIPLVGGQVLGSRAAIGRGPDVMMSYAPFAGNDQYIRRYLPKVPFHILDGPAGPDAFINRWGKKLDIITSTCPCAGLSTFSSAKTGSDIRESRNVWMKNTCDWVLRELEPKVYLGENAPNLFTEMGRSVSNFMIETAEKYDYGLTFFKTSTVYHGIPQRRPRTFYAFWKGGTAPVLRWFDRNHPPARDYLRPASEVPSETFGPVLIGDSGYAFLQARYGSEWRTGGGAETYDVMDTIMKGQMLREFVGTWDGVQDNTFRTCKRRLEKIDGNVFAAVPTFARDQESYPSVIAKYANQLVHPTEERFLNYREMAWLMGMPLDFELPPVNQFNVVCQNVPVNTARDITLDPIEFCKGKLQPSGHRVVWYDNVTRRVYHGRDRLPLGDGGDMCAHELVFA